MRKNPIETVGSVTKIIFDLSGRSAKSAPIEMSDLRNNCHGQVNGKTTYQNQQATGNTAAPKLRVEGSVGYSLPYALRQHEDLDLSHDRTDGYRREDGTTVNMVAGGQAKYLEEPYEANLPKYMATIKKGVQNTFK